MRSTLRLSSPLLRYAAMALDALLVMVCAMGAYEWRLGAPDPINS